MDGGAAQPQQGLDLGLDLAQKNKMWGQGGADAGESAVVAVGLDFAATRRCRSRPRVRRMSEWIYERVYEGTAWCEKWIMRG